MTSKEAKEIADGLLQVLEERGYISKPVDIKANPPKLERGIEEYTGTPVMKDDKIVPAFKTQTKCDFQETKDHPKCAETLWVLRVKKEEVLKDDRGYGGQLIYNDRNAKYFYHCAVHGPSIEKLKW